MAHQIMTHDQWVYNRQSAWHNLGVVLNEDMTPAQALTIAGLDWKVGFADSYQANFGKVVVPVSTRTLYRLPQGEQTEYIEMGTVGGDYTPVQNSTLAEIAYAFSNDAKVESAGSLFNGKKVIMTLRAETCGLRNDVMHKYIALVSGHDGTIALSALPTSVRIVCDNTLSMALKQGRGSMFTAKHFKSVDRAIAEMKGAVDLYKRTSSFFDERTAALDVKLNTKLLHEYFTTMYAEMNPKDDMTDFDNLLNATTQIEEWIIDLEREMNILEEKEPTYWLAANAITKTIQHANPGRASAGWVERRAWGNLMGAEQGKSIDVFNRTLQMV